MLLRVSRITFWLAALAAAVALAVPTGWETGLTGFAAVASALAYALWRSGVAQLRRDETVRALVPVAVPFAGSALDEAAAMIEARCAAAGTFEAALHGVARILKTELGALRVVVYRVVGADETHARVSELIESAPGFHSAEHRLHLRRSAVGMAITTRLEVIDAGGAVALPVPGADAVVAVIEMTGMQIDIDADALALLLARAREQLARRAEPVATGRRRRRPEGGGLSARLGENG
ncbi:MAG: hypothetical protein ABI671_04980 [Burkholderiales bacterium]